MSKQQPTVKKLWCSQCHKGSCYHLTSKEHGKNKQTNKQTKNWTWQRQQQQLILIFSIFIYCKGSGHPNCKEIILLSPVAMHANNFLFIHLVLSVIFLPLPTNEANGIGFVVIGVECRKTESTFFILMGNERK